VIVMAGLRHNAAKVRTHHDKVPAGMKYREDGGIAEITLARPDRLNAITFEIYAGLRDLFKSFQSRKDIRAVVLTGEGRAFSSGGDVRDIIGKLLEMDRHELGEFTELTCDVVEKMRACPQPIVAALNGTVAGAGAALAIACDIRVATNDAKIAFLFVKAGLSSADMGASFLLPRIIGLGRASQLLLTGEFIDAKTAEQWGLYNRVVDPTNLRPVAWTIAKKLASGPALGVPAGKDTINSQMRGSLHEALMHDAKLQADLMTHPDFQEAFDAFNEKRPPKFG
jgi:enoyl-CoA hydratase/carnithine racemase